MLVPNLRTQPERTFHAVYSLIDECQEGRFNEKRKILTTYCGKTVALISTNPGRFIPSNEQFIGNLAGSYVAIFGIPIAKVDAAD
jgi:hypothetical protein